MLFVTMNYVLMSVFEKARSYFPAFLYRTKVTLITGRNMASQAHGTLFSKPGLVTLMTAEGPLW